MPNLFTNTASKLTKTARIFALVDVWSNATKLDIFLLLNGYVINILGSMLKPISSGALAKAVQMAIDDESSFPVGNFEITPTQLLYSSLLLGGASFVSDAYNARFIAPIARRHQKDLIHRITSGFTSGVTYEEFLEQKAALEGSSTIQGVLPGILDVYTSITATTFSNMIPRIGALVFGMLFTNLFQINSSEDDTDGELKYLSYFILTYLVVAWVSNEILSIYFNTQEAAQNLKDSSDEFHRNMRRLTADQLSVRIHQRTTFEESHVLNLYADFVNKKRILDNYESVFYIIDVLFVLMQVAYVAFLTKDGFTSSEVGNVAYMLSYLTLIHGSFRSVTGSLLDANNSVDELNVVYQVEQMLRERAYEFDSSPDVPPVPVTPEQSVGLYSVSYAPHGAAEYIFHDFSCEFSPGELVTVTGESGQGKTTLLELICRLRVADNGKICIQNTRISKMRLNDVFNKIVYIPVDPKFIESKPVLYNLLYGIVDDHGLKHIQSFTKAAEIAGKWKAVHGSPTLERCTEVLDSLGIKYLMDRDYTTLSKGEAQRLGIARGFLRAEVKKINIILFDEATANLDRESATKVKKVILGLTNCTRIVVTHTEGEYGSAVRNLVIKKSDVAVEVPQNRHAAGADETTPLLVPVARAGAYSIQ